MKLDLVNAEKSDIKYKISKYPDGQQNIELIDPHEYWRNHTSNHEIIIQSRLNNWMDLELICCSVAVLRRCFNHTRVNISLIVPYFLGARSDRQFGEWTNSYLKDVIAPVINNLNLRGVQVYDPHSSVLDAVINNLHPHDSTFLLKWAIGEIYPHEASYGFSSGAIPNYPFILISPDAGASHKIYKLAEKIGYTGDIITCSKERDKEGELTKVNVPTEGKNIGNKDLIIIDDICDGGATFINIAKEIKSKRTNKIYLIVTHGIFSKGFAELDKYFDGIYCTNSYQDKDDFLVNPGDPTSDRQAECINIKLKQLNVF